MPKFNTETKRARVAELIKRLERKETVQARDINLVLSKQQQREMNNAWNGQIDLRKQEKPADVTEYEQMLQQALLAYGQFVKYSAKQPKAGKIVIDRKARADKLRNKSDGLFEAALEHLQEIIQADPSLCVWFDREADFTAGSDISIDPIGMPRVITSRSLDNEAKGAFEVRFGKMTITENKLEALRRALAELDAELRTDEEKELDAAKLLAQTAKLKEFMANLKKKY